MKTQTFLVRSKTGQEAVMRLPVGKYGKLTRKAFTMIGDRFYDGTTKQKGLLEYALNLEAYSNGTELLKALEKFNNNII